MANISKPSFLLISNKISGLDLFCDGCKCKYFVYNNNTHNLDIINKLEQSKEYNSLAIVFDTSDINTIFINNNSFISKILPNNTCLFLKKIVDRYHFKTIDFLACNLLQYSYWKDYFIYLEKYLKIPIRASNNITGNNNDWILENYNFNCENLYFNQRIKLWNYKLDSNPHLFTIIKDNKLYISGENPIKYYFNHYLDYLSNYLSGNILSITNKYILLNNNKLYEYTNGIIYSGFDNVIKVISNDYISIIITNETINNMYLLGDNDNGQLGLGHNNIVLTFTQTIVNKKILDACISNNYLVCIITDENIDNIYISGINSNVFTPIVLNKYIYYITAGYNTLAFLTSDLINNCYLYSCGINTFLNINHTGITSKNIIKISCGNNIVGAISNDLSNNLYLLNNTTFINLNFDVSDICLTNNNYYIYTTNNTLLGMGLNLNGSLGIGTTNIQSNFIIINIEFSNFVSVDNDYIIIKNNNNFYSVKNLNTYFNMINFDKNVVKISNGSEHLLVLTDEPINNLYSIGNNINYATGLNTNIGYTYSLTNVNIGYKVLDCYAGNNNSFIIVDLPINNLYVVGQNDYGQLGLPDSVVSSFTQIISNSYIRTAGGYNHSYYIDNDYNIYFSGLSNYGQTTSFTNLNTFTLAKFPYKILKADIGVYHSIFIADLPINNVFGIGKTDTNSYGKNYYTFNTITSLFGINYTISKIAFGLDFGGFISDTYLFVFGNNSDYQLGLNDNYIYTPTQLDYRPIDMDFGDNFSVILLDVPYVTGNNTYGQLGLGDYINRQTYTPINTTLNFIKVKTYGFITGLLTIDCQLYMCGDNSFSQLGNTNYLKTNILEFIDDNIIDFSIGGKFTVYLKKDGNLFVSGYFCGFQYNTFTIFTNNICKTISNKTNLYCIDNNTNLHVCGDNTYGELGVGDTLPRYILTYVDNGISNITAGDTSSMYIKDGNILSCGNKFTNGLGVDINIYTPLLSGSMCYSKYNNSICNDSLILGKIGNSDNLPYQLTTNERSINVSCGFDSSSLITQNGNLLGCGLNGENGVSNVFIENLATNVNNIKNYKDNSTLVINSNLYVCGLNNSGQFGIGNFDSSSSYIENPYLSNVFIDYIYPTYVDAYFTRPILANTTYIINTNINPIIRTLENIDFNFQYINSELNILGNSIFSNSIGIFPIKIENLPKDRYFTNSITANLQIVEPSYIYTPDLDLSSNIFVGNVDSLYQIPNLTYISLNYISGNISSLPINMQLDLLNLPENRDFINLSRIESIDIQTYLSSKGYYIHDILYNLYFLVLKPSIGNGTVENPYILNFSKQFTSKKIGYFIPCMNGEIYRLNLYGNKYYFIRKTGDGVGEVLVNGMWNSFNNGDMLLVDRVQFVMYFTSIILYQSTVPCLTPEIDILCPNGYKNVCKLKIGDMVKTSDGRIVDIKNIIVSKVVCNTLNLDNYPYIIHKKSVNREFPSKDIRLSKNHLMLYRGFWIAPFQIRRAKLDTSVKTITYYNIQLPNYKTDHLIINGRCVVESYGMLDIEENRYRFSNRNYYYLTTLISQLGNKELDKTIGGITNHNVFIYACQNKHKDLLDYMLTFNMKINSFTLNNGLKYLEVDSELYNFITKNFMVF